MPDNRPNVQVRQEGIEGYADADKKKKKDKGYDLWDSKKQHDDYAEDVGWGPLPSHITKVTYSPGQEEK